MIMLWVAGFTPAHKTAMACQLETGWTTIVYKLPTEPTPQYTVWVAQSQQVGGVVKEGR